MISRINCLKRIGEGVKKYKIIDLEEKDEVNHRHFASGLLKSRKRMVRPHQFRPFFLSESENQNQNSLLVKRQNDNTSPGDWPRKISP